MQKGTGKVELQLQVSSPCSLLTCHFYCVKHLQIIPAVPEIVSSMTRQSFCVWLVKPSQQLILTQVPIKSANKIIMVLAIAILCLVFAGTPCITDCVMAELEKLGSKFRVAQRIAKDPRFERLPCTHKGTYADDCLVNRVYN